MWCAEFCSETLAKKGGRQTKELPGWIAASEPTYKTLPKDCPRRAIRLSTATRNFCICGVPHPSAHFGFTLQGCGSGQKLQSAAWGMPHFPPSPGPGGGKASDGAAGLDRIPHNEPQHLSKTCPSKNISIVQGLTQLLHVQHPATFGTFLVHMQRAEAATCGMGCTTFFAEPRAERVDTKRRSCKTGSQSPKRTTPPCQHMSREEHSDYPGPHATFAVVASRNLRNTSNSHFKAAAAGRSCKVRHGACHTFLRAPGRAPATRLHGWSASSQPNFNTPKHFPRRAFRLPRASRNFCMFSDPQPSEHFEITLQDCGSGQKLRCAARGTPHCSPSPGTSGG
jgi:hypothetical protein